MVTWNSPQCHCENYQWLFNVSFLASAMRRKGMKDLTSHFMLSRAQFATL